MTYDLPSRSPSADCNHFATSCPPRDAQHSVVEQRHTAPRTRIERASVGLNRGVDISVAHLLLYVLRQLARRERRPEGMAQVMRRDGLEPGELRKPAKGAADIRSVEQRSRRRREEPFAERRAAGRGGRLEPREMRLEHLGEPGR